MLVEQERQQSQRPGQIGEDDRLERTFHGQGSDRQRRDAGQSGVTAGDVARLGNDRQRDQLKGERSEGEIMAAQPQQRQADDRRDERGRRRGDQQANQWRHAQIPSQQRRRVGADRVKGSLTERHLTSEAHQQRQPRDDDRGQGNEDVDRQRSGRQHQRQDDEQHQHDVLGSNAHQWVSSAVSGVRLACQIMIASITNSATPLCSAASE